MKFHKFMTCNEKSETKLSEATVLNGTWLEYDCLEELGELNDICIMYHMKVLFEMYYYRVHHDYYKPVSNQRIYRRHDLTYHPTSAKRLYY